MRLGRNPKLVISLVYFGSRAALRFAARLIGLPQHPKLTILYYHSVPPEQRHNFVRQMDILQSKACVLPASFTGELPGDKPCVAITFDDAFVSVLENALPELAARRLPCAIFVPVGLLGKHPSWVMEELDDVGEVVASAEQLRQASGKLVVLGSHSLTHPRLSKISLDRAELEIKESRRELRDVIGKDVDLFAFPYGDENAALIELCKQAGYRYVFTALPGSVDPSGPNVVRGRVNVDLTDRPIEFFLKYQGAYAWTRHLTRLKRRVKSALSSVQSRRHETPAHYAASPTSPKA